MAEESRHAISVGPALRADLYALACPLGSEANAPPEQLGEPLYRTRRKRSLIQNKCFAAAACYYRCRLRRMRVRPIYRTLGSEVTLIEKADRVLSGWESEAKRENYLKG